MNPQSASIGAFDSGVGGLSVLREVHRLLPSEDLIYVADSAHAPYGDKAAADVIARTEAISAYLLQQGVKAIVVACNTATGIAVDRLRSHIAIPIVAIEPAVKPAAATTKNGRVGVLATTGTLASQRFATLVSTHGHHADVASQPCPGLVERVEAGDLDGPVTRALVERYVQPLLTHGVDTIVLGCTHYSFLTPLIREVVGGAVSVIDPAPAVAAEVKRRLSAQGLLTPNARHGTVRMMTTGTAESAHALFARLWPTPFTLATIDR